MSQVLVGLRKQFINNFIFQLAPMLLVLITIIVFSWYRVCSPAAYTVHGVLREYCTVH